MGRLFKPSHQHSLLSITSHVVAHCLHNQTLRDLGIYMYCIVENTPTGDELKWFLNEGGRDAFSRVSLQNTPSSHTVRVAVLFPQLLYQVRPSLTLQKSASITFPEGERWADLIHLCPHSHS